MSKFTIRIPEPCHEDWQQMLPDEKGRFCLSCQKSVIDFTDKSQEEIEQIIQNSKGKLCGRFLESQLTAEVAVREKKQPLGWWKVYALAISAMFTAQLAKPSPAKAQTPTGQYTQNPDEHKTPQTYSTGHIAPFTISGRIFSVHDSLPVPGVEVSANHISTLSDSEGYFKIDLQDSVDTSYRTYLSLPGKHQRNIVLQLDKTPIPIRVVYKHVAVTGKVAVVTRKPSFLRRLSRRIYNLFS